MLILLVTFTETWLGIIALLVAAIFIYSQAKKYGGQESKWNMRLSKASDTRPNPETPNKEKGELKTGEGTEEAPSTDKTWRNLGLIFFAISLLSFLVLNFMHHPMYNADLSLNRALRVFPMTMAQLIGLTSDIENYINGGFIANYTWTFNLIRLLSLAARLTLTLLPFFAGLAFYTRNYNLARKLSTAHLTLGLIIGFVVAYAPIYIDPEVLRDAFLLIFLFLKPGAYLMLVAMIGMLVSASRARKAES